MYSVTVCCAGCIYCVLYSIFVCLCVMYLIVFHVSLTANPACDEVGCGEWSAPMIQNPNYKGKWKAPLIDNPEYDVRLSVLRK